MERRYNRVAPVPSSTDLANSWKRPFGQWPDRGHSSANAWPMADDQWPEKSQSSANGWPQSGHWSMAGQICAAWELSSWTRALGRASFDAMIGHEVHPNAEAALVSNPRLRSISL